MIDTVVFENDNGDKFMPYQRFGIFLKSYTVSPPKPKIYRFALDGMDGDVDLSEWAGEVKYENREAVISFRDINETFYRELVQFALGRSLKIMFSNDPDYYFRGRCEGIEAGTKQRVSDLDMTFTCGPYRLSRAPTKYQVTSSTSASVVLCAKRMTVNPTVTSNAACTFTWDGETINVASGTHVLSAMKIIDRPQVLTITGNATVTLSWTEGVL